MRLGILATGLMPTPGKIDKRYIDRIVENVNVLRRNGVYVLIDFHQDGFGPVVGDDGFPAWMTETGDAVNNHVPFPLYYAEDPATQQAFQSFWDDAAAADGSALQADYTAMWRAVAGRLAHDDDVLGYDLFNEPWPGNVWKSCLLAANGCPDLDASELGPVYAATVQAIRSTGDRHLIFGEPFVLFNFGLSTTSMPLPAGDAESGMAYHMYTLAAAQEPAVIANAVAWSQQTGGALLNDNGRHDHTRRHRTAGRRARPGPEPVDLLVHGRSSCAISANRRAGPT